MTTTDDHHYVKLLYITDARLWLIFLSKFTPEIVTCCCWDETNDNVDIYDLLLWKCGCSRCFVIFSAGAMRVMFWDI